MKLMRIRKGEFQMGSEELPSEKPPHRVRITKTSTWQATW